MEKLSRTKRFEDLRQQVTHDTESDVTLPITNPEQPVATEVEPTHIKITESVPATQAPVKPASDDFLDQLLKEAKQYGMNVGVRQEEDTAANVLSQINKREPAFPDDNRPKTSAEQAFEQQVIEEAKDLYLNNNNLDIAVKIKALLDDESFLYGLDDELQPTIDSGEPTVEQESPAVPFTIDIPSWDDTEEEVTAPTVAQQAPSIEEDFDFEIPSINEPTVSIASEQPEIEQIPDLETPTIEPVIEFETVADTEVPVVEKVLIEDIIEQPVVEQIVQSEPVDFSSNTISDDMFTETSAIDKLILQALLDLGVTDEEIANVDVKPTPEVEPVSLTEQLDLSGLRPLDVETLAKQVDDIPLEVIDTKTVEPEPTIMDFKTQATEEFSFDAFFDDSMDDSSTPISSYESDDDQFKMADVSHLIPKGESNKINSDDDFAQEEPPVIFFNPNVMPQSEPFVESQPARPTEPVNEPEPFIQPTFVESPQMVMSNQPRETVGEPVFNNSLVNPDFEATITQRVMEETKQLRLQLSDYEEDMFEVAHKVTLTNKVLNAILVFLILGLVVIIAIVVYWILIAQGIV